MTGPRDVPRDMHGRALGPDGQAVRWVYCIYCGHPLTSWWSQTEGFGNTCFVKLDHSERRRLYDGALQGALLETGRAGRLRRRDVWRSRFGLIRSH